MAKMLKISHKNSDKKYVAIQNIIEDNVEIFDEYYEYLSNIAQDGGYAGNVWELDNKDNCLEFYKEYIKLNQRKELRNGIRKI